MAADLVVATVAAAPPVPPVVACACPMPTMGAPVLGREAVGVVEGCGGAFPARSAVATPAEGAAVCIIPANPGCAVEEPLAGAGEPVVPPAVLEPAVAPAAGDVADEVCELADVPVLGRKLANGFCDAEAVLPKAALAAAAKVAISDWLKT